MFRVHDRWQMLVVDEQIPEGMVMAGEFELDQWHLEMKSTKETDIELTRARREGIETWVKKKGRVVEAERQLASLIGSGAFLLKQRDIAGAVADARSSDAAPGKGKGKGNARAIGPTHLMA